MDHTLIIPKLKGIMQNSWRRQCRKDGEKGLINRRPGPRNLSWRTVPEIEEKVLHLRRTYHFGAKRISWFLQRYRGVGISEVGVRGTRSLRCRMGSLFSTGP